MLRACVRYSGFDRDVVNAPRMSQVTFARKVTFAVVRAAAKKWLELAYAKAAR
jgi:hypothetical protein